MSYNKDNHADGEKRSFSFPQKTLSPSLLYIFLSLLYFFPHLTRKEALLHEDIIDLMYPLMNIVKEQFLNGTFPFWNMYIFSGTPLMANAQSAVLYPPLLVLTILLPPFMAILADFILHTAFTGLFTYLYARKIGIEEFPAFMAGLLFAFMGFVINHLGHYSIVHTAMWIPLVLLCLETIRSSQTLRSAFATSLVFALFLLAGHPQINFYGLLLIGAYVLFLTLMTNGQQRLRFISLVLLGILLGFVIASPQIYATYEYSLLTQRGDASYEFFSTFSLTPSQALGTAPLIGTTHHMGYMGVVPFLLALTGLFIWRKKSSHVGFWALIALISFLLALGDTLRPLHQLMFEVPVYNQFRSPYRHLLEFSLAISILFAFGITAASRKETSRSALIILSVLVLTSLGVSAALIIPASKGLPVLGNITVPVLITVSPLAALAMSWKRGDKRYFHVLVLAVVLFEVISFQGHKWGPARDITRYRAALYNRISGPGHRSAFFDNFTGGTPLAALHGVSLIGGYDAMVPGNYDKMFILMTVGSRPLIWEKLVEQNAILSMMNVKYVIVPPDYTVPPAANATYKQLEETQTYTLLENLNVMPRAYSVNALIPMEDDLQSITRALYLQTVMPPASATVSQQSIEEIGADTFSPGEVSIVDYYHDRVALNTSFAVRGFVILADQYYPGWRAYIDGVETTIYRTNGIHRGVVVPPGDHRLVFVYQPYRIYMLMALSGCVFAGILLVLFITRPRAREPVPET